MKQKCSNNNCLRTVTERGLCKKCTDLINSGVRKRKAAKPIKKESSRNYSKALREAKRSFQLLRRLQEADDKGMVKCIGGSYRHYTKCDGSHYIPAERLFTCFIPDNVNCHEKFLNLTMHNPVVSMQYRNWLIEKVGLQRVEWLEMASHLTIKYSTFELIEMKKQYDKEIAEIKSKKNI